MPRFDQAEFRRLLALLSCRRGAEVLRASRHSIWRWRMVIIGALKPEPSDTLAGIVEADEAYQRVSRKGSREWVQAPA